MATVETPRLLTPREVAARLRVGRMTVYRLINRGELPAVRLGTHQGPLRVDAAELREWLERRRVATGQS